MPQPSKRPSRLVSPIVWLGGKGRNWQWVISHFPEHRVYVEPFGGGASVLLNKPSVDVEVYNDLDLRVYHLFAMLRCKRKSRQLIRQLRLTPYHEHEYSLAWSGDLSKDPTERARQIFVQLRMAFGGLGSRGVRPGFGFGKSSSKSEFLELHRAARRRLRATAIGDSHVQVWHRRDQAIRWARLAALLRSTLRSKLAN